MEINEYLAKVLTALPDDVEVFFDLTLDSEGNIPLGAPYIGVSQKISFLINNVKEEENAN